MKRTISALMALVLLACGASAASALQICDTPVGMDISGFSTVDFDQNPVDGSIFGNAALTVINFWETGCGPCISEMPYFQQAHEYYSATPEADVQVYTVLYVGSGSNVPDGISLLQSYTFGKLVIDSVLSEALNATEIMPGMLAFPETILVDSNGIVRYHHFASYQSYNELRGEIEQWLPQVPPVSPTPISADGDANGDSLTDLTDALLCLRASMGLVSFGAEQTAHCDMDGDGNITIADALSILRISMGILGS